VALKKHHQMHTLDEVAFFPEAQNGSNFAGRNKQRLWK